MDNFFWRWRSENGGAMWRRLLLVCALGAPGVWGQGTQAPPKDLTSTSLEDLMNVEVTSVSKKEQKLSEVPAALFVITQEDIRHSGARNIPDLLRMVPGLDVGQINGNTWAISARGFNLQFANKLLVLVDGRAVYTPLFGGVYWDTLDMPLDDIDRIEVIRGPGGAVWGANAVNGVINVISKKAAATQGVLVSGGGGTVTQAFGNVRYGGKVKDDTQYRIFANYQNTDHLPDGEGQESNDGWHLLHGGFREDTKIGGKDTLTTEGDLYTGSSGATVRTSELNPLQNITVEEARSLSGGDFLGRWDHKFSNRYDVTLQVYFDKYKRSSAISSEDRKTADIDFQNHLAVGERQDLIFGVEYRRTADETVGTPGFSFTPADFSGSLFSLFLQDEITLKPDRLALYVGTKLENSYFSGYELQPSVRVAWTPENHRTIWAGVSRASRTPTRFDTGLNSLEAAPGGQAVILFEGNRNFQPEHVITYEAGYRSQVSHQISLDLTAFLNSYTHLETVEGLPPFLDTNFVPPLFAFPNLLENKMHGTTQGVEAYGTWKVTSRWTLSPGYSLLEMHLRTDASSTDTMRAADTDGSSPEQQAQLRSHVELPKGFSWDLNSYFVGRLPAQQVASYTRVDTQVTWKFHERASFSVVGQNLLHDHHFEFNDQLQNVNSSQVKRGIYAKLTWEF